MDLNNISKYKRIEPPDSSASSINKKIKLLNINSRDNISVEISKVCLKRNFDGIRDDVRLCLLF